MQWVLLAVIVTALLYMSRFYPRVAFSILGALIIGATVIVVSTNDVADNNRSRLPAADIQIENPLMATAYGGGYRFNARLLNTNPSTTLKESTVSITMLDCPVGSGDNDDNCRVIGQQDERIIVKIPPGQARDVSRTLSFDSANPEGTVRWQFKITETRS